MKKLYLAHSTAIKILSQLSDIFSSFIKILIGHAKETVVSLSFSTDENFLASSVHDEAVVVWSTENFSWIDRFSIGQIVRNVSWRSSSKIITATDKGEVITWKKYDKKDQWYLKWKANQIWLMCKGVKLEGAQGLSPGDIHMLNQEGAVGNLDLSIQRQSSDIDLRDDGVISPRISLEFSVV